MSKETERRRSLLGILIPLVTVIIILDQVSKAYFVYILGRHTSTSFWEFISGYASLWGSTNGTGAITANYAPFLTPIGIWQPWLAFNLTTNTGAAWSMFAGNSFVLSGVSLVMAALLYWVWWRSFRFHHSMTWALGGIIGGALGNFIDRFRLKEVVDFIDVRIPLIGKVFPTLGDPYDFPIFNVADSCAVVGTMALAVYLILVDIHTFKQKKASDLSPNPEGAPGTEDWDPALVKAEKGPSPGPPAALSNPDGEGNGDGS